MVRFRMRNKVRVRVRVRVRDRVRDRVTSGFFFLFLSSYIAPFALRRIQKA